MVLVSFVCVSTMWKQIVTEKIVFFFFFFQEAKADCTETLKLLETIHSALFLTIIYLYVVEFFLSHHAIIENFLSESVPE